MRGIHIRKLKLYLTLLVIKVIYLGFKTILCQKGHYLKKIKLCYSTCGKIVQNFPNVSTSVPPNFTKIQVITDSIKFEMIWNNYITLLSKWNSTYLYGILYVYWQVWPEAIVSSLDSKTLPTRIGVLFSVLLIISKNHYSSVPTYMHSYTLDGVAKRATRKRCHQKWR